MTNRERFLKILSYEKCDRMPAVHFGYWRETLQKWAAQGHISSELADKCEDGNEYDDRLNEILGFDFCYTSNWCVHTGLDPWFDERVIKTEGDCEYVSDCVGVVHMKKKNVQSIPVEVDYLLKDRAVFTRDFLPRMRFDEKRFSCQQAQKLSGEWDRPKGLFVGSAFGDIRNMLTVMGMSYMMCDDYGLLADIVQAYSDMQYQGIRYVLQQGLRFDFMHFWEDICFKNGPLLAPEMFKDLCQKNYLRMSELAKKHGVPFVSVDCDGDVTLLLKIWQEGGVNVMFPIEYGTWQGSIEKIRALTGREMRGVGGMNKEVLSYDRAAVDEEIARLRRLVRLGGYIPCPDHRLPPSADFDLTRYYAEKIKTVELY